MPLVALRPIVSKNWKECIALRLAPDQERWLPSTLYSIAEAQFYPEAQAREVSTKPFEREDTYAPDPPMARDWQLS